MPPRRQCPNCFGAMAEFAREGRPAADGLGTEVLRTWRCNCGQQFREVQRVPEPEEYGRPARPDPPRARQGQKSPGQLRREAGPLGRLDFSVEAVCALGRGERPREQWVDREPTDAQEAWLRKHGVEPRPGLDRGQTSRLISLAKEQLGIEEGQDGPNPADRLRRSVEGRWAAQVGVAESLRDSMAGPLRAQFEALAARSR